MFRRNVLYLLYQAAKPATSDGTTLTKPGGILRPTLNFLLALGPLGGAGPGMGLEGPLQLEGIWAQAKLLLTKF